MVFNTMRCGGTLKFWSPTGFANWQSAFTAAHCASLRIGQYRELVAGALSNTPRRAVWFSGSGYGPAQSFDPANLAFAWAEYRARVNAVAGIGNPEGFFQQLEAAGYRLNRVPLPDHFDYEQSIQNKLVKGPVLLTDKDAVKSGAIGGDDTGWSKLRWTR